MNLSDAFCIIAPSVQVTTGAASALITIPNDASGAVAKAVRIESKATAYILPQTSPFATGFVQFSATVVPLTNDTVTIAGTVVTWKTSGAVGLQININTTDNKANALALFNLISASADANLLTCRYAYSLTDGTGGLQVRVIGQVAGINTVTLAESSNATTVSAATLTGSVVVAATAANSILINASEALILRTVGLSSLTYIQETAATVVNISPIEMG